MDEQRTKLARRCSPFLDRLVTHNPGWLETLEQQGRLREDLPPNRQTLEETVAAQGLDAGLRQFRNREMLRITWREITATATLDQTMKDLSELADLCLDVAIAHHHEALENRFGKPVSADGKNLRLVTLGLGKLGGGELNLSSDIDLIFAYEQAGECDGKRGLSAESFFTRLVRAVIRSLSEMTEDGFCFRVDTRLRPFGESGPLVCSFGAMEQYYQREGRDWERYALIKARPVAGDLAAGNELLHTLRPFVYRRYVDYGSVEALRDMLGMIRADAARAGRENDVKRGPGGIREVEFLVQCVQLLRGGREPSLQTRSLLAALDAIDELGAMPKSRTDALRRDYRFLRRVENAIQALHDQQTHTLPEGEDLERVALASGFDDSAGLLDALAQTRAHVSGALEDSFPRNPAEKAGDVVTGWSEALDALADTWPEAVAGFRDRLARQAHSHRAGARLDQFMPLLVERLQSVAPDDRVINDVFQLVLAISRRSAYLALLVQNPGALDRMLSLFSNSPQMAQSVTRHPALLDELIDPALGSLLPGTKDLEAGLARVLEGAEDTESAVNALNYLRQAQTLRVAVAEIQGELDAEATQRRLSELAEVLVSGTLDVARRYMRERHGEPPPPGLAVIAYGSLGGHAMSYGSDLDLVFLYGEGGGQTDGERPLAAETWYTRLTRRMLALTTTLSPAGRLYDVDTRLRPNGRAGLLVSSGNAFRRYQLDSAWTWELQALVRARAVAGDTQVAQLFEDVRRQALARPRDPDQTHREVADMRVRMRAEINAEDTAKHAPGGLVDIDFVVQLGTLLMAHEHPQILDHHGSDDLLAALGETGWLDPVDASTLRRARDRLNAARHARALGRRGDVAVLPDTSATAEICERILAGDSATTS
ncbi:bifunctional [glutamate--ammonia ligase]-adenylyl-L-tyrosine phosphorylase/[glutamate--ammonia-ligase] adenylyltransferase [Marinihelvus fidelis]|uniref:Bifunctional glutamine synthetase adenylyltransferase/adenylyl-removing enzyme n=1 Tax=Marinihelvus fidelis TaxID=2613842 RepID=A0A5N0TBR1_9GAMM|nr:bifunctional [glutamate--ammonia ligase]-adenylyl-L-tyrosine phosphorylase/[glutamate--ammonia-ligase] adenylyltransferase [Marinihelvus fidelis]KAA9131517.1 bifunctional [glutamate--ammonia ligase]-adenylyl-L-tyrosine phosphorylase/[glutamate--ammonia-ligase] adenylyltransferase [Marinihelvus fidelis]